MRRQMHALRTLHDCLALRCLGRDAALRACVPNRLRPDAMLTMQMLVCDDYISEIRLW
jgi:hypothetical protein